jgi:hypothetical protein
MIAGCIMYIRDYRYWFSLDDYRVIAQSQIIEQRLWEIFPKRCLTFWPYMYSDAKGIKEFLERDMPVIVDTQSTWTGKFTTKIEWLRAWVKVQWRGKLWCISRDGKMWEDSPGRQNDEDAGHLVWKINELEEEEPPHIYGVFKSPLSTEVIADFIDEFRGFKWFDAATEITWERRAGMDLFTLKLSHGAQRFELQLQRGKYSNQEIGINIENIFTGLLKKGGNHIIDATYEGKIFLRNL